MLPDPDSEIIGQANRTDVIDLKTHHFDDTTGAFRIEIFIERGPADKPTILSFYTPFIYPGQSVEMQCTMGRTELLMTTYRQYERRIHAQMMRLFGSTGFRPDRDVAGLILDYLESITAKSKPEA